MDPTTILLFIVLLLLSGFFSSTEIALMSIPSHKIESLIRQGKWGARQLADIKKNTDRLLVTIQIGNNLVNVFIASYATQIAINIAKNSGFPEATIIGISTGIITLLLITFGEIMPKSFGVKNAELFSTLSAPVYKILIFVLTPVTIVFEYIIRFFTGKNRTHTMSDEELESFIDMGKDAGTIDEAEHEKLIGVLELDNRSAQDIMTPRVDIYALEESISIDEAIQDYIKNAHSRIPVFKKTIDKIHSYITIHDLVSAQAKKLGEKKLREIPLHKVLKIPLNQPLDRLLELLQKNNKHMAIIIDEYGGVGGLLTLEDILEEVFGEIRDETDTEIDGVKEISPGVYSVDSTVMIDEVLEEYDLELYHIGLDVKEFSSETVSYIVTHKIERFPHTAEIIPFDIVVNDERSKEIERLDFKILEVQDGRIGNVEVSAIYRETK